MNIDSLTLHFYMTPFISVTSRCVGFGKKRKQLDNRMKAQF